MASRLVSGILSLLFISGTLVSCSQSEEHKAAPPAVDELQGHWQSNCVEGQYHALSAKTPLGITQKSQLVIDGSNASEVTTISSLKCDSNDIETTLSGTFERSVTAIPNRKAIDIKMQTYKVTPHSEFGVRVLNLSKWCGISEWAIDQERDVTSEVGKDKCFDLRSIATVYSVEGENLYFGKIDKLATSALERPTDLQKDLFFTREQK